MAYLVAGLIKGIGILYIEKLQIIDKIETITNDPKSDTQKKYGALNLIICLVENLGKLFEPFIPKIL